MKMKITMEIYILKKSLQDSNIAHPSSSFPDQKSERGSFFLHT